MIEVQVLALGVGCTPWLLRWTGLIEHHYESIVAHTMLCRNSGNLDILPHSAANGILGLHYAATDSTL